MACVSDYMESTNFEVELSRVACLLDELDGKTSKPSYWDGYHPLVYTKNIGKEVGDQMVRRLCESLQNEDVSKFSLEMQIWWRDHQEADKTRIGQELAKARKEEEREAVLGRLTPHERDLLGIG